MSRPRIIALLLALITLFTYLPATRFDFVDYDDDDYVSNNTVVQGGLTLAGIKWAFTTGHASNWHPVTWLSHMTDCELFKLNAGGHHLVSVLLHAVNTALLFLLLLRLTEKIWPSAFVAALFAWHPVHVESVAWVAERKDVLSAFFALLTLLSYVEFARHKSRQWFWLAWVCFALGLMAKPMLVTLPFVMLLLDYWPLKRLPPPLAKWTPWREKIPFFLLAIISSAITVIVQREGHAIASLDRIPLYFRLENATVAPLRYVQKIFWPENLSVIYPIAPISLKAFALGSVFLIMICAGAWHWRKAKPYFLTGWLWFLGTLVPVIGLVQVGSTSMADRYTYIPALGIFIAVVFSLDELAFRAQWSAKFFAAAAALVLAMCLFLTERQLAFWRNSETLFQHALAVTRNNDVAHIDLGAALSLQGRNQEAIFEYQQAVRINPGRYQTHFNLGVMLGKTGRNGEALDEYYAALRIEPDIAITRSAVGSSLASLGRYDEAIKEFDAAEQLDPRYAMPHLENARVLFLEDKDAMAVDELRAALRAEPDNVQALATVAHYLAANENPSSRDGHSALILAIKANELCGHHQPMVFDILGMAFAETGDFTNAQVCAQNAVALAGEAKMRDAEPFQRRLELYQRQLPWHESFVATNGTMKK